jgi:hypothetical protein
MIHTLEKKRRVATNNSKTQLAFIQRKKKWKIQQEKRGTNYVERKSSERGLETNARQWG